MFSSLRSAAMSVLSTPEERARAAADRLGLVSLPNPDVEAYNSVVEEGLRALSGPDGISRFETLHNEAFASKAVLHTGLRRYAVLEHALDRFVDSDRDNLMENEIALHAIRTAWEASDRRPFFAALYGKALFNTGYGYRGADWAGNVTQTGWEKLHEHVELAHEVFEETAEAAGTCPFWFRMLFQIGLSDGSDHSELESRFGDAQFFDPYDIDIYADRAYQLLPRWHGSYEAIEAFAQDAVAHTNERYGFMLYAWIYESIRHVELEDKADTLASWELLKRGFRDWFATTGTQYTLNVFAEYAHYHGDTGCLRELLEGPWDVFYPDAWQSPETAARVLENFPGRR
ncbi:MAG: hypothetical protein ACR2O4_10840 [Hyphomicrobiaceae bacterium]